MDQSILELLTKFIGNQNQSPSQNQNPKNPSASSYPPEAFMQSQNTQQSEGQSSHFQNNPMFALVSQLLSGGNVNPLSMITSLLGKDNPLANLMSISNKKEEEKSSSPKDEILL